MKNCATINKQKKMYNTWNKKMDDTNIIQDTENTILEYKSTTFHIG